MIQSKLIVGGNQIKRKQVIVNILEEKVGLDTIKPHPDLILIEGTNSISIDQIRELGRKVSLKPYLLPAKVVVIFEAEKLTLPAQNAFLKTLEEPPENTIFILSTTRADSLLPTIVSRCQIITLPETEEISLTKDEEMEFQGILTSILKSRIGERLLTATKYSKDKNQALRFLQALLVTSRQIMLQKPENNIINSIRNIQKAILMLEANTNPPLVMGNLLLSLY